MTKKVQNLWVVFSVLTIILISFSGCIGEESKFVGTWETSSGIDMFTFNSDGSYEFQSDTGKYSVNDGRLILVSNFNNITVSFDYHFSDNNNQLTVEGIAGTSLSYTLYKK